MWWTPYLCVLALGYVNCRVQDAGLGPKEENETKKIIQKAFRNLLNMKSLPPNSIRWGKKLFKSPPKYMLQLYEKYRTGKTGVVKQGSTIRSILAMKGNIRGNNMLIFNLSGVEDNEHITKGELHFFRKKNYHFSRGHRIFKKFKIRMILYDINEQHLLNLQNISLSPKAKGWQNYDVTRPAKICRFARSGHNLLGLKFERKRKKKFKTISPRKVIRHSMVPFLILFSENPDITDEVQAKKTDAVLSRLKRYVPENEVEKYQEISRTLKSSVYDNELPATIPFKKGLYIPKTNPGILQPRKKPRKLDSSNIIPIPKKKKQKKNRRWRKRFNQKQRKSKKGSTQFLPESWQGVDLSHNYTKIISEGQCEKKTMKIVFSEIGWTEWIISPKSFEANFCSGVCPFPLRKGFRPSNHAAIQSIVHAIGTRPEVPAPSCVPDVMSSLTLLYFDEDMNVVLKNYPGMIVERCACR